MKKGQEKISLDSTLKSMDTEEFIDLHFYRPIGYRWALLFDRLNISPNAVTIASIIIGIAAGICFYYTSLTINLIGMLLLIWANSYDSADGQLARMTGKTSQLGRTLDGLSGISWFIAIYAAICFRLFPSWGFWIWALAAFTGFFHGKQTELADYYRNIHLHFLKGKKFSELTDSATLKETGATLSWKRNFIQKFSVYYYTMYTKDQETWTPRFQQMMSLLREKFPLETPSRFREEFRAKSLPLMKFTNICSFNTRVIALFVALLINQPWLYFIFELIVLNFILIYMIIRHERICKYFVNRLSTEQYD
ncbi:MAG: CDP-alcohol phosphatidyltransferase family protein [Tannerella sp.]|nr:CDP-alcohol phosphatidyltransferase family protein [Tannerella sp.]